MTVRNRPQRTTPITMRDVAKLAKVSQSTVSRVLSGASDTIPIGEKTRQRVLKAVEQLGYQPNLHAGSLRGQKTRMVAIMVADITNPFYHPIIRAVQDVAYSHRYDVMVANSDHMQVSEHHFLESVIRRPVDGVLVVPYHLNDGELEDLIERTGAAVGVVGQHISNPQIDVAFGDDGQATADTITWLHVDKGHRRIGFIGVAQSFTAAVRRQAAYQRAIERAQLNIPAGYEQFGDWSLESGFQAMQRLLELPVPPTAVFVCNDLMAIGALDAAQQKGLRVPQDVAVVGFDDIPAASWVRPRLTTIAQYPGEMGERLATAIFERILGEYAGPGRRFEVPCRLVMREST
jgi:DNA-binding LacI/PurR family transcriptional regulator